MNYWRKFITWLRRSPDQFVGDAEFAQRVGELVRKRAITLRIDEDDLAQDVAIKVIIDIKNNGDLPTDANRFLARMSCIVKSASIDTIRKQTRYQLRPVGSDIESHTTELSKLESPESVVIEHELLEKIDSWITNDLSDQENLVLKLWYVDGCEIKVVAELLRIHPKTTYAIRDRAISKLKKLAEGEGFRGQL